MYNKASAYADSCIIYVDSINNITISENGNLIQSLKKKIELEQQNYELSNQKYLLIGLIIVIFIIITIIARITSLTIKNKNERYKKVKEALNLNEQSSQEEIIQRIKELDAKINKAQTEKNLEKEKELIFNKNNEAFQLAEVNRKKEKWEMTINLFKTSKVYTLLREKAYDPQNSMNISQTNWEFIYNFLNEKCNNFQKELEKLYRGINEKELRACCLLKLEFTNAQISNILNQSQPATSLMRKRLYEKIFHKKDSAEKLDVFIKSFCSTP